MNYGFCPSCANQLTDGSVLKTGQSKIFKGNNVYLMCKNCQRVMMYNVNRDLIFDLDEYKEDVEILQEIMDISEDLVRQYPEQYLWLYKRFLHIPPTIDEHGVVFISKISLLKFKSLNIFLNSNIFFSLNIIFY